MAVKSVSSPADRLLSAATQWGVRPDQPEGVFIEAVAETIKAIYARADTLEQKIDCMQGVNPSKIDHWMKLALTPAIKASKRTDDRKAWATITVAVLVALVMGGAAGDYLATRQAAQPIIATWQSPTHESCSIQLSKAQ